MSRETLIAEIGAMIAFRRFEGKQRVVRLLISERLLAVGAHFSAWLDVPILTH